jgi:hypothetical protein
VFLGRFQGSADLNVAGQRLPISGMQHYLQLSTINNSTTQHPIQSYNVSKSPSYCAIQPYISDNLEDDPPSGNRVLTEKHEWPTPTRVRVKQMFKDGHTRHAIEKETGVPGRSQ